MKVRKPFRLLFFLVLSGSLVFLIRWNSELNKNNRQLAAQLLANDFGRSDTAAELFEFDYDELYVFYPYQPKEAMEKQIGFEVQVLEETVNENMMNLLFIKEETAVAYLYGYGANNGYYLDLSAGNYSKSDLEKISYKVSSNKDGNSSRSEKRYLNYHFQ